MDDSTKIWTAANDAGLWVRVEGRGLADDCPLLRTFCETTLRDGQRTLFIVLSECEHFDSTFLGTLLCLQRVWGKPGGESLMVVAPCESCRTTLVRMGATHLFPIEPAPPPDNLEWAQLCGEQLGRETDVFQRNVLDAHLELAAVPGKLGAVYEPVARMAQQQFQSRQGTKSSTSDG